MKLPTASIALGLSVSLMLGASAEAQTQPLVVDGKPGVWLPRADADRVLFELTRTSSLADALRTADRLLDLQRVQLRTATTALALSEDVAARNLELAETALDAYRDEVRHNAAFFRQPAFWALVGALLGGTAVAAGAAATD